MGKLFLAGYSSRSEASKQRGLGLCQNHYRLCAHRYEQENRHGAAIYLCDQAPFVQRNSLLYRPNIDDQNCFVVIQASLEI